MTTDNMNADVLAAVRANLPEMHVEWLSEKLTELSQALEDLEAAHDTVESKEREIRDLTTEVRQLRGVERRLEEVAAREAKVAEDEQELRVKWAIAEAVDTERDRHVEIALEAMRLVTRNEHVRRTRFVTEDHGEVLQSGYGDPVAVDGGSTAREVTETDEVM